MRICWCAVCYIKYGVEIKHGTNVMEIAEVAPAQNRGLGIITRHWNRVKTRFKTLVGIILCIVLIVLIPGNILDIIVNCMSNQVQQLTTLNSQNFTTITV